MTRKACGSGKRGKKEAHPEGCAEIQITGFLGLSKELRTISPKKSV